MVTPTNVTMAPQKKKLSKLSVVGFLLAVLLPPLGVIISLIALILVIKMKQNGTFLSVSGIVVGILLSFTIFPLIGLVLFWGVAPNKAEAYSKPITAVMESAGGTKMCDNGDAGVGPDNTVPWYTAYYQIKDSSNLATTLTDIAKSKGIALRQDMATINTLKNADYGFVDNVTPDSSDFYQSDADYLVSNDNGNIVRILISRNTEVNIRCNSTQTKYTYSQGVMAENGQDIITIDTGAFSLD